MLIVRCLTQYALVKKLLSLSIRLLQGSQNMVPDRVTARGSNALRFKLTNGQRVFFLNKDCQVIECGRLWYNEFQNEAARGTESQADVRAPITPR